MKKPDVSYDSLRHRIYNINANDFEGVAMEVYKCQFARNPLYQQFCSLTGRHPDRVQSFREIPFLPISLFKDHEVKCGDWKATRVFRSSGTTGIQRSHHSIRDLDWYHRIAELGFQAAFGPAADWIWVGLLPSYLDRPDSSLVDMIHSFMLAGGHQENRFFPDTGTEVIKHLQRLMDDDRKVVLVGVTFALLDLFDAFEVPVWDNLLVMETGGMKGRGVELTRDEVYEQIRKRHDDLHLVSEYGMTELLSQAYRIRNRFYPSPQMKVLVRDLTDPFRILEDYQRGAINVVDLANLDTCSFVATDDVGITLPEGTFDVLGRMDNSDLRGCNLMYVSAS